MTSQSISFNVTGLSCASCVGRAEKALNGVAGVSDVAVNLASETATLSFKAPATIADITGSLKTAGYPAETAQVTFEVSGMSCGSCVGRVEKARSPADGVGDVAANLASVTATVTYLA
ncbi:MAG: heavy-metal-associated domain-containing protein, partial [Paracoccaceae bacterium]|nr:heavy-metal-associated domain-containing protein [Paracoccaceae bacterium]